MGDDLKQKMVGALTWSAIDRFGQQIVQFVIGLLLARLLTPDDFGLIGMVMVFAALSFVLVESGFTQALIRKQGITELYYNTIFYFNILISVILYLILFFSTPLIALLFHQPQLTLLGRVVFLVVIFNAFYLVPYAQLSKSMDFKTIAKVNLLSTGLSGLTGVILAFLHFGVWALVSQQVLFHFFRMFFFHVFVKWKPLRIFSFDVIREFWKFSLNLLGTSVLNVLFNNIYVLLISKFYPLKQVGYYTQANKLSETFNFTFQSILVGSTYSLFTQIQHDDERFRRIFREVAQKTSIVTFPIFLVLIAVANPLVFVLLSAKWMAIVPYFQLLCLAALFTPLYVLNISALNSRGQSKITFKVEIIKKILILLSVVVCFQFGIVALLWGYVFSNLVSYAISTLYLKKELTHYIKHQFTDFTFTILIGVVIAIFTFLLSFIFSNNYILLTFQIMLAAILYLLSIKLFFNDLFEKGLQFVSEKMILFKRRM